MKTILLCLHGWGGSKESFNELREALQGTDIEILSPDLPGFGSEPDPPEPWGIDDYAEWVERWLGKNRCVMVNVDEPSRRPSSFRPFDSAQGDTVTPPLYLLGHSLGGQIAVKIALRGNLRIRHLFLCAPAAIRPRFSLRRTAGYIIAKCGRTLLTLPGLFPLQPLLRRTLYRLMRVHDYEKASAIMQKTMIRVTHQNLTAELHKIQIPTDLFWGKDDRLTPLKNGLLMQKLIPKSTIHSFPNTRHSVHRDHAREIAAVIQEKLLHC